MGKHRHLATGGAVALALLASASAHGATGRLPWAAHNGLDFVQTVANEDVYRREASALAIKKTPSADVREFARTLWEDSILDRNLLTWVVNEHEPRVVLPYKVSAPDLFVIDQLVAVSGDEFDRRYIAQQTASLKDALALAQEYARAGDDFRLKDYAERRVPKIQQQLDRVLAIGNEHARVAAR